ncbi:hypothetical protein RhiirA5_405510 [Rhizophagus irregularis]|uniref:Uncharacterized protein n=1 Tax=Rhizophagus irregularis TaxID=588596 RepID=A0A2I1DVS1_9GLOM|nr:hypothetical protein RhiirA5_405510 [Rhizophagus irregularis]PKY13976.1 hypothetical protein RhiirB3_425891 [Rhizophagus irregularis]GET55815.1 hypothetical protein RIR_e61130_A0A2I1DVS1_9GLOM [Rhizophagus irregularis DAOM 181602=DAOM 197198]
MHSITTIIVIVKAMQAEIIPQCIISEYGFSYGSEQPFYKQQILLRIGNTTLLLDGDGAPPGAGALPAGDGRSKDHISVDMRSKIINNI